MKTDRYTKIFRVKRLLLIGLLLFPIFLQAQKIEVNKVDDFTNKKVIYTGWEYINWGIGHVGKQFQTKFGFENDNAFLLFNWICGTKIEVEEGARMLVKLDTGDIFELTNQNYEIARRGAATTDMLHGSIDDYGLSLSYIGNIAGFRDGLITNGRLLVSFSLFPCVLFRARGLCCQPLYSN